MSEKNSVSDILTSYFRGYIIKRNESDIASDNDTKESKINNYQIHLIPKYFHQFIIKLNGISGFDRVAQNTRNCNIKFIPTKDKSLVFRSCAGDDRGSVYDCHITHPGVYLYRIIRKKKCIGHVTLLDVADDLERRAILVDVINMTLIGKYDYNKFLHDFIDIIAGFIEKQGYDYLLFPKIENIFSNQETLQRVVSYILNGLSRIDNNFKLNPHKETFHSLRENILFIAKDFKEDRQTSLFDE